jgi:hypothetical protein
MKTICFLFAALLGTCALAQQTTSIPPLPKIDATVVLTKAATEKPHVLFVNVGRALDEALFREAVAAVSLVEPINLGVTEMKNLDGLNPLARDDWNKRFSKQAKLVVYVANKPDLVSYLNAPGRWALINLNGLDKGLPKEDPERYRRRLRQMMLKGLAQACGVGANFERHCVMYQESFVVDGIDQTSVSYSPFAWGPLQDRLLAAGGQEIMQPAQE